MVEEIILSVYWIVVFICIPLLCGIVYIIKRISSKDSATNVSVFMITAGVSLVSSAFAVPSVQDYIVRFCSEKHTNTVEVIVSHSEKQISVEPECVTALICGFILIALGWYYRHSILDRIFVLNMLGVSAQKEISEKNHIKELNLPDFKVKENIIDFVDLFQYGKMSSKNNTVIVEKIRKKCNDFQNRSIDTNACFTSMAPVPYTMLAGTYLSTSSIKRYFEYVSKGKYFIELSYKKDKKEFPKLSTQYSTLTKADSTELVLALSITFPVQDMDLVQFGCDIVHIKLNNPQDNVITRIEQLNQYCHYVVTEIETLRTRYHKLNTIHLAASVPGCFSEKLGELFKSKVNRLPKIIAYHFVNANQPKYPFGIIVCSSKENEYGKLIEA